MHWSADERLERNEYWSGSRMPVPCIGRKKFNP